MAICATILREADVYFFDEPSSYLDIHERMRIVRIIQELAETKRVIVIEHDLAVLDVLAHLAFSRLHVQRELQSMPISMDSLLRKMYEFVTSRFDS